MKNPLPIEEQLLFFNTNQVLNFIQCSYTTLWRLVSNGNFPKPTKIGGMNRWKKADIIAFINGKEGNNDE